MQWEDASRIVEEEVERAYRTMAFKADSLVCTLIVVVKHIRDHE